MELDWKNYVPILKWKRAEQSALKDLTAARKDVTVPIVEFVMPKPKGLPNGANINEYRSAAMLKMNNDKIDKFANEMENVWGNRPIFVDFTYIYPDVQVAVAERFIGTAQKVNLAVMPVINMSATKELMESIIKMRSDYSLKVALRISSADLDDIDTLNGRLVRYLNLPESNAGETSLVVDLKDLTDTNEYLRYAQIAQSITQLHSWGNFILASGAFPVDLSAYKLADDNEIVRRDWLNWNSHIDTNPQRPPTFSDYGIRHPVYVESSLLLFPTASLKYTLSDRWKLIKGQKHKFEQYLAAAYLISADDTIFYGENFSTGDTYIADKAKHLEAYQKDPSIKGTGSTESWLNAGLNHHMSVAADQVSS